ncbi:hypothetical protein DTO271D3_1599 [Paecilomyces variotii]|nr:hypothetical protein DTO217A2_6950 [Paecilomyces variotii]KAJ9318342.1 hypothetical protein DTO271D3_1599 [Paecilomyces variotii]
MARQKERVLILGGGWGGFVLSRHLSPAKYDITVVSPRQNFVFTPLLSEATVGTLEFSHVVEPVRDRKHRINFAPAVARSVDFVNKRVSCEASIVQGQATDIVVRSEPEKVESTREMRGKEQDVQRWRQGTKFEVDYDKLVIATGSITNTFNTPGVQENALLYRDIEDARKVQRRIRECFELAVLPNKPEELRTHLLHFAVVGGGPTGIEFVGLVADYIRRDLLKYYPQVKDRVRITLYDVAPKILGMFDESLSTYAMETMKLQGVDIKTSHHIEELRWGEPYKPRIDMDPKTCLTLKTKEDGETGVGMCVWATGNAINPFVKQALSDLDEFPEASVLKSPSGITQDAKPTGWKVKKNPKALLVDGYFRLQLEAKDGTTAVMKDVFAIGDNAMLEHGTPPATAIAANQEAKYLAQRLNKNDFDSAPRFSFRDMGLLAYIGDDKGLMQMPHTEATQRSKMVPEGLTGRTAWLIWRGAYLSLVLSWRNCFLILIYWVLSRLFGRRIQ